MSEEFAAETLGGRHLPRPSAELFAYDDGPKGLQPGRPRPDLHDSVMRFREPQPLPFPPDRWGTASLLARF